MSWVSWVLRVEDEDGSDSLVGHVHQALGVDGDAVGSDQLERKSLGVEFLSLRIGRPQAGPSSLLWAWQLAAGV